MNLSTVALGVDIAKAKFDVCLIKDNGKTKHKIFPNTLSGFEQLNGWLDSHQDRKPSHLSGGNGQLR